MITLERSPLVRMAFELYATGTYSFRAWPNLTDAGLRMKPTKRHPAGALIPVHKLRYLLWDRYYLGYVTYKGVGHQSRHER